MPSARTHAPTLFTLAGKKLVELMLSSKSHGLKAITTEEDAVALGQHLLNCEKPVCVARARARAHAAPAAPARTPLRRSAARSCPLP
jgi:hypothetical protein